MSALPFMPSAPDGQSTSALVADDDGTTDQDVLDIPPPIPTAPATWAQIRASIEIGLAQARAGVGEDFEVVQARLRAKYCLPEQ